MSSTTTIAMTTVQQTQATNIVSYKLLTAYASSTASIAIICSSHPKRASGNVQCIGPLCFNCSVAMSQEEEFCKVNSDPVIDLADHTCK